MLFFDRACVVLDEGLNWTRGRGRVKVAVVAIGACRREEVVISPTRESLSELEN